MTAIAKRKPDEPQAVQVQSEASSIFTMIERLAGQPEIPIERMEKLFDFYQKVESEKARRAYHAAFAEMQPSLPVVAKRGSNDHTKKKYARFEDIAADIMPVLKQYGFGLSFQVSDQNSKVLVRCILSHCGGHFETNEFSFPYDTGPGRSPIQAIGSAMTYGKRYTATTLLGIATADEVDDDGKAAGGGGTISEAQYKELADLITATGTDLNKFLEVGKVESLSDIFASKFEAAKAMLIAKQRKQAHADH